MPCVCVWHGGIIRAAVTISGSRLCGVWSVECGVLTWGWAGPFAVCVCGTGGLSELPSPSAARGCVECGVWSADLGLGGTSCRVCVWHGGLSELPSPSAARGCVECGVWSADLGLGGTSCRVCVCGTGDYQSCRHHQRLEAVSSVECGVLTWGWAGPLAVCVCGTGDYQSCRHHQRLEAVWSVECGVWSADLGLGGTSCRVCVWHGGLSELPSPSAARGCVECGVWSVEC